MNFLQALVNEAEQKKKQLQNVIHNDVINPVEHAASAVGHTIAQAPQAINRDVVRPSYNYMANGGVIGHYSQPFRNFSQGLTSGLERSAVGTAQGISGLDDALNHRLGLYQGQSPVSQNLTNVAKHIDLRANQVHANPLVYHGAQALGDLAQFGLGSGEAKVAGRAAQELPKVGSLVRNGVRVVNNAETGVNDLTKGLRGGNVAQRIVGNTAKNVLNPTYQAGNAAFTALQTGKDIANGRQVTPQQVATNLAVGGIGFPAAGAVGREGAIAAKNTPRIVRNVAQNTATTTHDIMTSKPFRNVTDQELSSAQKVRNSMQGYGSLGPELTEKDMANYRTVQKKIGVDANNHDAVDNVIGARRTYQTRQDYLKSPEVSQGGYVRMPFDSKNTGDLYKQLDAVSAEMNKHPQGSPGWHAAANKADALAGQIKDSEFADAQAASKQPTIPVGGERQDIAGVNKFGWKAQQTNKGLQLFNRNNAHVATIVTAKNGRHTAFNTAGQRIVTGGGPIDKLAQDVATKHFYAAELPQTGTGGTLRPDKTPTPNINPAVQSEFSPEQAAIIQARTSQAKAAIKAQNTSPITTAYHSTPSLKIEGGQLRPSPDGSMGPGVYLHTNENAAKEHAAYQADGNLADQTAHKVNIKSKDIYNWPDNNYPTSEQIAVIKRYGHDGVKLKNGEMVIFDPKKVELAHPTQVGKTETLRPLTQQQMIDRGADGHLRKAIETNIPINKIDGREPTPAMEGGYKKGTPIKQPVEVQYQPDTDKYILYAGNHRVTQAELNGQTTIPAFVEPETGNFKDLNTADFSKPEVPKTPPKPPSKRSLVDNAAVAAKGMIEGPKAPENPLLAEARKYKSADEFANSLNKMKYGAVTRIGELPIEKINKRQVKALYERGLPHTDTNMKVSDFQPGRKVVEPLEVFTKGNTFVVENGNHRLAQALANGDKTVPVVFKGGDGKNYGTPIEDFYNQAHATKPKRSLFKPLDESGKAVLSEDGSVVPTGKKLAQKLRGKDQSAEAVLASPQKKLHSSANSTADAAKTPAARLSGEVGSAKSGAPVKAVSSEPSVAEPDNAISRFPNRLLEEDRTEPIHKTLLQNVTHEVKHNKDVLAQTSEDITKNEDAALALAKRGSSTEANATALQLLDKYLSEGQYEKADDLVKSVSPRFTRQGQETQILATYSKLTPAGAVRYANKQLSNAVQDTPKGKALENTTSTVHSGIQKEAKDVADQISNEVAEGKIGKTVSKATKKVKETAQKEEKTPEQMLADRIHATNERTHNEPDPIKDMVNTLHQVAKQVLPKEGKAVPRNPMELIGQAVKDKTRYSSVYDKAQKLVYEKYKDNPAALEELDKYFNSQVSRPFSQNQLNRGVSQGLKGVDLGKIVKQHYTTVDATGKELSDKLIEQAGLSKSEATQLAGDIQSRYNELVKARKDSIIKQIFGEHPKPTQLSAADRILQWHNLGALSRDELHPLVGQKLGVPTLSAEATKKISDMAKAIQELPEGSPQRMRKTVEMMKFISNQVPTGKVKGALGIWKAGLLSGTKTILGNPLSNETFYGMKKASDPSSIAFDKALQVAGKTSIGKKLGLTGERSYAPTFMGEVSGTKQGIQQGFGKQGTLRTGIDMRDALAANKYEQHGELNFSHPVMQKVFGNPSNSVFRLMSSADQPVYYRALQNSLANQAKATGMSRGLRGTALRDFMQNAVKNPTERMAEVSKHEADMSVLGQDSKLGSTLSRFGQEHPAFQTVVPFTKVPTNFLSRTTDYTPVGAIKGLVKAAGQVRSGEGIDQRMLSQALGEATTGTALIAIGKTLADNGLISGQYPSDQKEQQRWKVNQIQPNSVHVGNHWISLNYMGPLGLLFGAGKDYHDANSQGNNGAVAATLGAGKNLAGQSFLSGFSGLTNAINDPARSAGSYINSQVASVAPSWLNDIANLTDKMQRQTDNPIEALKNRVPALREGNKVKQDVYGNPLSQAGGRPNTVNPLRPSTDISQKNAAVAEVTRLHNVDPNNKDLQVTPTPIDKKITVGKQEVKLSDKQRYDLQKQVGQATQDNWSKLIKTPEYQALDDTGKAKALSDMRTDVASAIQRKYMVQNSLATYDKAATSKEAAILNNETDFASYASNVANGTGSVKVASSINNDEKSFLTKYNAMNTTDRDKAAYSQNDFDYKLLQAKYDNDKANGTLSKADNIKRQAALTKAKVGKDFSKDVRDLYSVNKSDLATWLATEEKGVDKQKIANDLIAYDNALYNAGVSTSRKFKNGIAPSTARGGSGGSRAKLTPSDFKTPYDSLGTSSSKGAALARNVKLVRRATVAVKASKAPAKKALPTLKKRAIA